MNTEETLAWIWEPFFTSGDEWVPSKERMERVRERAEQAGFGDRFEVSR